MVSWKHGFMIHASMTTRRQHNSPHSRYRSIINFRAGRMMGRPPKLPLNIELLRRLAREKGGECLSSTYTGVLDTYDWRCNTCGREWRARAAGLVYHGYFCGSCAQKRRWEQDANRVRIADAQSLARSKGGLFLSGEFRSSQENYLWRCRCGHEWMTSYSDVKVGHWCPECGKKKIGEALSYTREEINALAQSLGGELIDMNYKGGHVSHLFRCANGHEFKKRPQNLTRTNHLARSWCPKCSRRLNISEEICRAILETAFGRRFPNTFPGEWLQNSRSRKMQLDGYCADLQLAFEYQGEQHFEEVALFNNQLTLDDRIKDDILKAWLCQEHGIKLVCIPYFGKLDVPVADLIQHVASAFADARAELPPVDSEVVLRVLAREFIEPMRHLAEVAGAKGGQALSTTYLGMNAKYRWKCERGHEWDAVASSVKSGRWCPTCAGKQPRTIEQMHALAASRGGRCLSTEYHARRPLHWECGDCRHQWKARAEQIVQKGTWCPNCAISKPRQKARVALLKLLHSRRLASVTEFTGSRDPITIACASGHQRTFREARELRRYLLEQGGVQCKRCTRDSYPVTG